MDELGNQPKDQTLKKTAARAEINHNGLALQCLSRRYFLSRFFAAIASAYVGPSLLRNLLDRELLAEAAELSREVVTVDLHCHASSRSSEGPLANLSDDMKSGRLDAGVFAVRGDYPVIRMDASGHYHELRQPRAGELFQRTQEQLDKIIETIKTGKLALAHSPADVLEAKKKGSPCAILSIEGSDPLEGEPSRVKFFYDLGLRTLQLVHYRINEIGDIQTEEPRHKGLTPFGRDVVKEMNKLGMVIDTAHCSSDTLAVVLAESRYPVMFSHTGSYALRKMPRHLQDKDMQAIAKKGGIIGIWPLLRRRETFETFLKEVDYVKNLVGADNVGIGTDLYGLAGETAIPTHKEFALIPAGLLNRGYAESDVTKIVGGNFMRLFREVTENRG
jgi:membrane dipeptidase